MGKRTVTPLLLALALLSGCGTLGGGGATAGAADLSPGSRTPIVWGRPYLEGSLTIVPGSLKAGFGRFDFFWSVTGRGEGRLMTREPLGSAERGMRDVILYPYFAGGGSAFIFMERKPLLNSGEPHTLTLVAEVSSDELMAGLAMGEKFRQTLP